VKRLASSELKARLCLVLIIWKAGAFLLSADGQVLALKCGDAMTNGASEKNKDKQK